MLELKATERKRTGKRDLESLRLEGFLPAVVYGRKEKPTPIKISERDFRALFREAGESSIISLTGVGENKEVLVQDVDYDPVTSKVRHADFYAVEKDKKLTVQVPLEFVGVAPAVKELGGTLVKVIHELEIEVLPKDLPQEIKVDVSSIVDFDTQIHVKDIKLPEGVTALVPENEVVASASEVQEEVEEVVEAPDLDAIEVEQKGKDDGEGGAEAAAPEASEEKKES